MSRKQGPPLIICMPLLLLCVIVCEADFDFTIRFYEFRNPLGLQCDECGSDGGLPACCDDVQRRENCVNMAPFTCDTRFQFLLRPFGSPVETAPNTGFSLFTPGSGANSETFTEGHGGFLAYPNPYTISRSTPWPGRIQFFIDAVDRPVAMSTSGLSETLAVINRFPIDLELDLGTNFTERTTYTGIYNISGLGFDMSFRVQCAENFFGPNCCPEENFFGPSCNMSCMPLEGVYTCDREGSVVCLNDNRDPSTNCSTCLQGWDLTTNCSTCSLSLCSAFPSDPPSSVIPQAALGGVLGVSLVINAIFAVAVVALLVKIKDLQHTSSSTREEAIDIDMKPNTVYGLASESIVTKPNEVYGVAATTTDPSEPEAYDYVNP